MKKPVSRLLLWLLPAVLALSLVGFVVGKYVTQSTLNAQITFRASLASDLILQEHEAVSQSDGTYQLSQTEVAQNTYYLIPGLDIPKDPHIHIQGKTPIASYLFVEVVDTIGNDAVTWQIDGAFTELTDVVGDHGGRVFVYNGVLTDKNTPADPINILQNQQVKVSQHLNCDGGALTDSLLTFYVQLIQRTDDATAQQAYNHYK